MARQLKNIGPKLAEKMMESGIDSADRLRALGAKKAFEKMYKNGDSYADFNAAYLYALEGAIRDRDWADIPETVKKEYQQYAKKLQRMKKQN